MFITSSGQSISPSFGTIPLKYASTTWVGTWTNSWGKYNSWLISTTFEQPTSMRRTCKCSHRSGNYSPKNCYKAYSTSSRYNKPYSSFLSMWKVQAKRLWKLQNSYTEKIPLIWLVRAETTFTQWTWNCNKTFASIIGCIYTGHVFCQHGECMSPACYS